MKWIGLLALLFLAKFATAQKDHRYLRQGDRSYQQEDLGAAEEAYRKALEAKESAKGAYNLGNTIYKQGRYDEAVKHYEKAAIEGNDPQSKANAFHNLGNTYFQQNEYAKSVDAYKNALRLNPNDMETKINLAQAMRLIPPPEDQDQQQEGESEENSEEEQNQDQQQQEDQSSGDEQEQQQQQEQSQDQQSQQSPAESEGEKQDLSREEAERLLQIMENEEQKTMEKLRQAKSKTCSSPKDW